MSPISRRPTVLAAPRETRIDAFTTPLMTGRNDGLHYLVYLPPLEGAEVVSYGEWLAESGAEFESGKFERSSVGTAARLNRSYGEGFMRLRYGIAPAFEARGSVPIGGRDGDLLLSRNNAPLLRSGRSDISQGDLVLGVKWRFYRAADAISGISLGTAVKFPTGSRSEIMSTGGTDLALTGDVSQKTRLAVLHGQAAAIFTGKEEIFLQRTLLAEVYAWSVGATIPMGGRLAVMTQVQGNTNAFREIDALPNNPISAHLGVRWDSPLGTLDGGFGFGLVKSSPETVVTFVVKRSF